MSRLAGATRIDRAAIRRIAIVLLVGGMVAIAGCTDAASDDGPGTGDANATDPIEYVPQGQDVLLGVDAAIVGDQTTTDLAAALEDEEVQQDDPREALQDFEERSGLDATAIEGVLVFGQSPSGDVSTDSVQNEEYAMIFQADWSEEDVVSAIERNRSSDLPVTSHQGEDVLYGPIGEDGDDRPTYLGVLGDGTFVLGDEAAVTASLDVGYGDASAVSGPLRDAYEGAPDGLVTFAVTIPQGAMDQAGGVGASVGQDVEAFNGAYSTEGDQVVFETQLLTASEESAEQLQGALQAFVGMSGETDEQTRIVEALQYISVEQDGATVRITFEASVDQIVELSEST